MNIGRLRIVLPEEEYFALIQCAMAELRSPSDQARWILRCELEKLGWLTYTDLAETPLPRAGGEGLPTNRLTSS